MKHQLRNSDYNLKPEEIRRLIKASDSNRNGLIISLFAFTGLRRAELRGIRKEECCLEQRRIFIQKGKGGKTRYVFIPDEIVGKLKTFMTTHHHEFIFTNNLGGQLSLRSINKIVSKIGKNADVMNPNPKYKNIGPHLLRHSMARNWKNCGGSIEALQKILGHKSIKTTMDLYGTLSYRDIQTKFDQVSHWLVSETNCT